MTTTPPSRLPTWADGGGADVTDPGTSKQADGWVEAESPAADHTNWILNNSGEWAAFFQKTLAPQMAFNNLTHTDTSPFDTGTVTYKIRYDTLAAKWYCTTQSDTTDDYKGYESSDGASWGSGTTIDGATVAATIGAQIWSNGSNIGAAVNDSFYLSSSESVAGFGAATDTFASITAVQGLVWDDTNSVWIAAGVAAGNDHIETSTSAGTAWTSRLNTSGDIKGIATDGAGTSVVVTAAFASQYLSTDGTTWGLCTTAPTEGLTAVVWSPSLEAFIAPGVSTNIWISPDGDDWTDLSADTVINIGQPEGFIVSDYFALTTENGTPNRSLMFPVPIAEVDNVCYLELGVLADEAFTPQQLKDGNLFEGNGSAIVYVNEDDKLVYSQFGPTG